MSGTRIGIGVVVRRADGWVLVARRLAEPGQPLALLGGKLDAGETVEEGAVRELAEETGIVLAAAAVRVFAAILVDGWLVAGVVGAAPPDVEPRELEPGKIGDFAWIDPAAPPDGLYPATAQLLAHLFSQACST